MVNTSITEKKYLRIPAVLFTADGSTDGVITVLSTKGFKVGQKVTLESSTQDQLLLKVKRVVSDTQLKVGPQNTGICDFSDISAFTTADGATMELFEQFRPKIELLEINRQVYAEEPTVAIRSHLVDYWGKSFCPDNPFPITDTALDFEPTHFEAAVATAGTPDNITVTGKELQLAFVFNPNKGPSKNGPQDVLFVTIDNSTKKTTIPRGASRYFPGKFDTLKVDTNSDNTNYEIIVWTEV